jgi:hypothetical protein
VHRNNIHSSLVALTFTFFLALASAPALAAMVTFRADMKGSNEIPPNSSNGTGTLSAIFDTVKMELTWHGNYSGLSSKVIATHFAGPAAPHENAGIALPITGGQPRFAGSTRLNERQAADLIAGRWYINISTETYRRGEIRGQVVKGK